MSGWTRIGIVLLVAWVMFCIGLALYDWQALGEVQKCCQFNNEAAAVETVIAAGYGDQSTLEGAKTWLAATRSLQSLAVLSWLVPALAYGASRAVRWVRIGFSNPKT